MNYTKESLIYENTLACTQDINGFRLEGEADISFDSGAMQISHKLTEDLGQKANLVYWCPVDFPDNIEISWKFKPISEPGLCIMFFCAKGIGGEDIFSEKLQVRNGVYNLYHSGDINCYHVSYFRRKWEEERRFHTCNLRKSRGFHLVAQGADPLPGVEDVRGFYDIKIIKYGEYVGFFIDDLIIFEWYDRDEFGKALSGGKIGFRQMAPMTAQYKELKVYKITQ